MIISLAGEITRHYFSWSIICSVDWVCSRTDLWHSLKLYFPANNFYMLHGLCDEGKQGTKRKSIKVSSTQWWWLGWGWQHNTTCVMPCLIITRAVWSMSPAQHQEWRMQSAWPEMWDERKWLIIDWTDSPLLALCPLCRMLLAVIIVHSRSSRRPLETISTFSVSKYDSQAMAVISHTVTGIVSSLGLITGHHRI